MHAFFPQQDHNETEPLFLGKAALTISCRGLRSIIVNDRPDSSYSTVNVGMAGLSASCFTRL